MSSSNVNPFTGLPFSARYKDLYKKRSTLPVWSYREKLLELLDKHQVRAFFVALTFLVSVLPWSAKRGQGKRLRFPNGVWIMFE